MKTVRTTRTSRPSLPLVERLIRRALLSVSVVKETLTIEGTAGRDEISLSVHPQVINLMSVNVNGEEEVFLLGSFKVININALGGNDLVRIRDLYDGHPAWLNVDLGPGNDRAYGSPHNDKIIGGTGNDRISSGGGNDSVNAGAGNDIIVGDAGNDTLVGLDGADTIYGGAGNDAIFAGDGADSLDGGDAADVVDGGWGNDRIVETDLYSSAGYDDYTRNVNLINGGVGDDYIQLSSPGSMSDVFGGDGNDYLYAKRDGPYVDGLQMNGEGGDDKIISPVANGGDGNDTIVTFEFFGKTSVDGGDGEDQISLVGSSNGNVSGGNGNDVIDSERSYSTVVNGESGDDRLTSRSGIVMLIGGAGNDLIATNGRAEGGAGDDLLRPASDYLEGDVTPAAVDFSGGDGNDLLIGSAYPDMLKGDDGDDILQGGDAADSLEGGAGDDALFGGNDIDSLRGNAGNDSLFAGGMNDTNRREDGEDFAYGDDGEDYFDKKSKWAETDKSNRVSRNFLSSSSGSLASGGTLVMGSNGSVSYGATISAVNHGSSGRLTLSGSVSYNDLLQLAQNYGNPTTTTTIPSTPSVDDAVILYSNAAIFSGMRSTSAVSTQVQIPDLLAAERKSVRGQFVHLPSEWKLTRLGKKEGLIWYEVNRADSSRATVYGDLKGNLYQHTAYDYDAGEMVTRMVRNGLGSGNLSVKVMGVHPASALLFDVAPAMSAYSASLTAPASFASTMSLVTRPGTSALLPDSGAVITINQPRSGALDSISLIANQRYLYTAQGLRTVDANGVGAIIA